MSQTSLLDYDEYKLLVAFCGLNLFRNVVRMPPLCTENTKCTGFKPNRFVPELCDVCEGLLYDHKQNPEAPSAKHFVVPPEQKTGETLPKKAAAKYQVSAEADTLVKKAEARRGPKKRFWQRRKKKRRKKEKIARRKATAREAEPPCRAGGA